jgi:hypothetical protein
VLTRSVCTPGTGPASDLRSDAVPFPQAGEVPRVTQPPGAGAGAGGVGVVGAMHRMIGSAA